MAKYIANQAHALELISVYDHFTRFPNDIGTLNQAVRKYCQDEFNRDGNLKHPYDNDLTPSIAQVCRRAVLEANRYNGKVARQMLKKMK